MNFGLIEQLTHSTVRIETILPNGSISTKTGFYMNLLQGLVKISSWLANSPTNNCSYLSVIGICL